MTPATPSPAGCMASTPGPPQPPARSCSQGTPFQALDAVAAALEAEAATTSRPAQTMFERLAAMVIKVAMLSAAGHPKATERDDLRVTPADVQTAQVVATHWREQLPSASRDGSGRTTSNEYSSAAWTTPPGDRVLRRVIAQVAHVSKDTLDKFEAPLRTADRSGSCPQEADQVQSHDRIITAIAPCRIRKTGDSCHRLRRTKEAILIRFPFGEIWSGKIAAKNAANGNQQDCCGRPPGPAAIW